MLVIAAGGAQVVTNGADDSSLPMPVSRALGLLSLFGFHGFTASSCCLYQPLQPVATGFSIFLARQ
jgi:hypothetical protein